MAEQKVDTVPDQNKINGLQIAVLKVNTDKDGKYNIPDVIPFIVDQPTVEIHAISQDALKDCVKQLEAMGSFEEICKENDYRKEGEKSAGLVITSKKDPRICCSVEFGGKWTKDSDAQFYPTDMTAPFKQDMTLKFFADVENLKGNMGTGAVPERPATPEELDVINRAREDAKLESMLGLEKPLLTESVVQETGEPDQNYDKEFYDAICKAIKKAGFQCKHRELDKYQGVYIDVLKDGKKVSRLWGDEFFVVGKMKPKRPPYISAELVDAEGDKMSVTRGDYFQKSPNFVFKDADLILTTPEGEEKVIHNPKVKDLPDLLDVGFGEYEGEPDNVMVTYPEEDPEMKFDIQISADNKKVSGDIDALVSYLKHGGQMGEEKNFSGDFDAVDIFGIPKEVGESTLVSVKPMGDKAVSTKMTDFKSGDHLVHKDPQSKEKEVDSKVKELKGEEEPNKAGDTLAAPKEVPLGVKSGEKEHPDTALKVGDPGDDHGDHVEGKGKSDDQQKELPSSKVKLGDPGDDHGKPVGESIDSLIKICDGLIASGLTEAADKVLGAIKILKENGMMSRVRERMMARRKAGKKPETKKEEPAAVEAKKEACKTEMTKKVLSPEAKEKLKARWKK